MYRERAGLSQAQLAERIFVARSYISHFESGRSVPDLEQTQRLARALGVTVAELIGETTPPRPVDYRAMLEEIERAARAGITAIETELRSDSAQSAVPYYGRVPADSVRWVEAREAGAVESVWDRFLAGRSPNACFTVRVSGNCLLEDGIIDGNMVLCEWANGRPPAQNAIALVRFSDEFTLKHWFREGDEITLRDGAGRVIHRFPVAAEIEVVGIYVTHWPVI